MRSCSSNLLLAAVSAVGISNLILAGNDAVLLRLQDDTQQVRVEAMDPGTGRWMAIASGYRDHADSGWLKIPLPDAYGASQLRVMTNSAKSPFTGKLQTAARPEAVMLDYPPSNDVMRLDDTTGGPERSGDPVIEEADIWALENNTLFFYNQYRGLQVIDMSDPTDPQWLDYFRYPAKGEDLYSLGGGNVVLLGTGNYWGGEKLALQFLQFDGASLSHTDTVELEAGYYMDSRRYGDYLYVLTREWIQQVNPDGVTRNAPLIRLYTIALTGTGQERVVDVKSYESKGWLDAVLTAQPDGILLSINRWENWSSTGGWRWRSDVHVLVPGDNGIPVAIGVAPLSGILPDKYKMNFANGLLTTISQQADWSTMQFSRATILENFNLGDDGFEKIGHLSLAPGETLFASRFYGDSVYVVTFEQVDPLFSIDNSNPTKPFIAGELEIPGWSNYIEWVGQYLFAVGIETSKVTVSIFDVNDPANMVMKDRVYLNDDSWAWSEAQYDDQAISFYPEIGLLMLPFTTWSFAANEMVQAMQLITWDSTGDLALRGRISHLDIPRRGVLKDDYVVTVSGRQLVTSDVSDLDLPVEGGSTTLAWSVQHLIPHETHWMQLESPEQSYYYWEIPSSSPLYNVPKLYVTPKDDPNVLESEIELAKGRLLGVVHRNDQLILVQDVSEEIVTDYWTIPEKQELAVRVYDVTDPVNPVLTGEISAQLPYIGNAFDPILLPDGFVLWKTKRTMMYHIMMLDTIWPGPWYGLNTVGYVVTKAGVDGSVEISAHETLPIQQSWYNSGGWFWEDPLLIASHTNYEEVVIPEAYSKYRARTVMHAYDFTDPANPVKLPLAELPTHLVDVMSAGSDGNHYLYFEPDYRTVSVWGWDGANAFPLFKQALSDDGGSQSSYTLSWLAPFNVRNNNSYIDEKWDNSIDVWFHDQQGNLLRKVTSHKLDNAWFRDDSVKGDTFLLATNDQVHVFDKDDSSGKFAWMESIDLPFPNLYSMSLDASVIDQSLLYIPSGIYGVDTIAMQDKPPARIESYLNLEVSVSAWSEVSPTSWQKVSSADHDSAGIVYNLQWLYYPDSIHEVDPDALDLGDLWRQSSWFGYYAHSSSKPFEIEHLDHGTLHLPLQGPAGYGGIFLYDPDLGYFWSSQQCYPFMYIYNKQEWVFYIDGTGQTGNRWFYGMGSGWFNDN